jgi:hypothetical protein
LTMMSWLIERPRPVPSPVGLVVRRARIAGARTRHDARPRQNFTMSDPIQTLRFTPWHDQYRRSA